MDGREYDRSLNEKSEGGCDVMASYSPRFTSLAHNTMVITEHIYQQHQPPPPPPTQKKSLLFNVQSP